MHKKWYDYKAVTVPVEDESPGHWACAVCTHGGM